MCCKAIRQLRARGTPAVPDRTQLVDAAEAPGSDQKLFPTIILIGERTEVIDGVREDFLLQ